MLRFQNPTRTKSAEFTWTKIMKDWQIYKQAKKNDDFSMMSEAAFRITESQKNLGIKRAKFPELQKAETREF